MIRKTHRENGEEEDWIGSRKNGRRKEGEFVGMENEVDESEG